MAKLIMKSWKKVLILLGVLCILVLLYQKIAIKPNIVENYLDSDMSVDSDLIDGVGNATEQITDKVESDIANSSDENDETMSTVWKWGFIIGGIFLVIVILDCIIQTPAAKKGK